jgi:hypothetical protein
MVQLERFTFFLGIAVIIPVFILVFTLNYNYAHATEKSLDSSSALNSYTDSEIGVSLEHPADWKVVNRTNGFQLIKEKGVVFIEVSRNNTESSATQLEQYVKDEIKMKSSSRKQFDLLNKTQTTISGNLPAYNALYTFISTKGLYDLKAKGETYKILRIWTLSQGNAYSIGYVSLEDKYDLYLPTAEKIINSIKITGLEKNATIPTIAPTTNATTNVTIPTIAPTTNATTNESSIISGGAGEAPSIQGNVTGPSEASKQTYENATFGIKMQYPSNWKVVGFTDRVRFVSPKEDTNDKYLQTIDLFTYPATSLNQAIESLANYYNTSLTNFTKIGSTHASVGSSSSSISFMYSFKEAKIGPLRAMDFIVSPEGRDKTYLVIFRDEVLKFQRDLPEAQKIIDSIKFLK